MLNHAGRRNDTQSGKLQYCIVFRTPTAATHVKERRADDSIFCNEAKIIPAENTISSSRVEQERYQEVRRWTARRGGDYMG